MYTCNSSVRGIEDYDGYGNMANSLKVSESYEAFYETNKIVFPNGKRAYIPAAGEMKMIKDNISAVGRCWRAIQGSLGSPVLSNLEYWTSTESDKMSISPNGNFSRPAMVWDESNERWIDGWDSDSEEDADSKASDDWLVYAYVLPICLY